MKAVSPKRRLLLKAAMGGAWIATLALGTLRPILARAAQWNKAAFEARALDEALAGIGASSAIESDRILIKAPDSAEDGAVVPVEVTSLLPGTQSIYLIAEKNPQPLVAVFDIAPSLEPFISTRIKMGESAKIRVLVKAAGKFHVASRAVEVTVGGCGG